MKEDMHQFGIGVHRNKNSKHCDEEKSLSCDTTLEKRSHIFYITEDQHKKKDHTRL